MPPNQPESSVVLSPQTLARLGGALYLLVIAIFKGIDLDRWRQRAPVAAAALVALVAGCSATSHPPSHATNGPVDGNSFAVHDVRVFDGERAIEHADVVVRGGTIASVGRDANADGLPVIDGAGRTLLPGLIDAHGHVPRAEHLRVALRFGVTTVLDMFTAVEVMQAERGRRDDLRATDAADLYSAGAPVTSPGGMGTQFGFKFDTLTQPADAESFVRARLAEGSDYIKVMYEPNAGNFSSISAETLAAVIATAHAQHVLAVVHVSSIEGARAAVEAHADGLAHVFGDALVDDALAQQMAAQHMFVTATLGAFAFLGGSGSDPRPELASDPRVSPFLTAKQREALTKPSPGKDSPMAAFFARFDLENASENVRRLRAAGVRILAGDDAANFGPHGVSLLGELQLLTRAGLTPAEALRAATCGPADAFGLAERGRIAPGARADLVLVDGNPLADITATRSIVRIFKNGFEVRRTPPADKP